MRWLDLIRAGSDLYGVHGECCPPVVDPYTFVALIAGIALITWFLQMVIVMTEFTPPGMMRFRRDVHNYKNRTDETGNITLRYIFILHIYRHYVLVYDLMSGVFNDILDEDSDDELKEPVERFQDDFKTEIKTRRKNFKNEYALMTLNMIIRSLCQPALDLFIRGFCPSCEPRSVWNTLKVMRLIRYFVFSPKSCFRIVNLDIPSLFLNGNVSAPSMFGNLKSISLVRNIIKMYPSNPRQIDLNSGKTISFLLSGSWLLSEDATTHSNLTWIKTL